MNTTSAEIWLEQFQTRNNVLYFNTLPLQQTLAKHVMGIHMNAVQTGEDLKEGELSLSLLKKYIGFCRRYEATFLPLSFLLLYSMDELSS